MTRAMPPSASSMASDPVASARRNTIDDAFRRAARRHRMRPALAFEDRMWSLEELYAAAGRIAAWLSGQGLAVGDRVLAFGRNSDAYYLLWLACCRGGFIHVPVNYALKADELRFVHQHSGARAVICDADLKAAFGRAGLGGMAASLSFVDDGYDLLAVARDPALPDISPAPEFGGVAIAQLLYTSGTTGRPKAAAMTHEALLSEYGACIADCDYHRDDRTLAAMPLYHSAQLHAFTTPQLLTGARTRLLATPEPEHVLQSIAREGATSFFAPPTVWINLLRHPAFDAYDLTSLEKIYYGAAIMPEPVLSELARRLPRAGLYNVYGQSEIAPVATVLLPAEHAARPTSAGRPIMSVETRVVDGEMREVAPGVHGEIVHRSPQLLAGYWNGDGETDEAFAGGWFHSGDVGYLDEDGFLFVVDRLKDVINTGGVLVASREVEDVLLRHPAVSEAAVIALPDPKWIEVIAAVVVPRDGQVIDPLGLTDHARDALAPYKVPKRIIVEASLPKNTAGKVLKRELRARLAGSGPARSTVTAR